MHLLLRCANVVSKNKIETASKKIELKSHASLFSLNRWFWESLKNIVRESLESRERERLSAASRWCNIDERGVVMNGGGRESGLLLISAYVPPKSPGY